MSPKSKVFVGTVVWAVTAVLLVPAMMLPATPLHAKQTWNVSIFGPSRALTRGLEKAKATMEAASGGEFEMKLHYASSLAGPKETLDSIKIGAFEAGAMCAGYHPGKLPLTTVIELPFIQTTDIRENARIQHALFTHEAVVKEWKQRWNAVYFQNLIVPTYEFMGNRRIGSTADMDGVRMRISGLNATVLQDFGAVPAMVTSPETYDALSKGTIDMIGYPWTYAFGAFKLYEVSKYATEGMAMGGFACAIAVSADAWNALPDKLKAMLPQLQQDGLEAQFAAYAEADEKWLPVFKERLEVVPFPAAERRKLISRAEPHWMAWAKERDAEGMPGTALLNFAKSLTK